MRSLWPNRKAVAILREPRSPAADPQELALRALVWVLADETRADRLLALTGLSPQELRAGIGDPGLLCAVLEFLCANESDLIAAAEALGVSPGELAAAQQRLAT